MNVFNSGPFAYVAGRKSKVYKTDSIEWSLIYKGRNLGMATVPSQAKQTEVIEALSSQLADWVNEQKKHYAPSRIDLIDIATGDAITSFRSYSLAGMTPGIIDDRSKYWIRSADKKRSLPVNITAYSDILRKHAAAENSWITGLLPIDVLIQDADEWRAPTGLEIRHVVGEGSLTGISGAKAAFLVGVTPQNFRKYTAADSASTRQGMSYAMWHLLLHKLKVQNIEIA